MTKQEFLMKVLLRKKKENDENVLKMAEEFKSGSGSYSDRVELYARICACNSFNDGMAFVVSILEDLEEND